MVLKMPYRWCMRVRILITPKYSKEKKIFCSGGGFGSLLSIPPTPVDHSVYAFCFRCNATGLVEYLIRF